MASTQDMAPVKNISLYIPRMAEDSHKFSTFATLTDFVAHKFQMLDIGLVRDIEYKKGFVNKDGRVYYKAIVHFDLWNDSQTARSLQDRILNPSKYSCKHARLVYDDPHYWMLLEHKVEPKVQAFELVTKLENQLAQVTKIAQLFQMAQLNQSQTSSSGSYEWAAPGNKRSRFETYGY